LVPPNILSQLQQAKDLNSLISLLTGIFGTAASAGGGFSLSSLIPPLIVLGGGKSTLLLSVPATAAQFSDALTTVQSGRKVLMRTQQGKPATFFVGDRFPVTLSLLSSAVNGAVRANPGAAANPFPSTSYDVGAGPVSLVAADFRNIGLLDLAALNEIDNSISILVNQGGTRAGTFITPATTLVLGPPRTNPPALRAPL